MYDYTEDCITLNTESLLKYFTCGQMVRRYSAPLVMSVSVIVSIRAVYIIVID